MEITLAREKRTFRCSGAAKRRRRRTRWWSAASGSPLLDAETSSGCRARVACPTCGPKSRPCPGCGLGRVTKSVAESVVRLCRILRVKHVAEFYGLDWDTVKNLDVAALAEQSLPVDLSKVTTIAMDEFALRKGHR